MICVVYVSFQNLLRGHICRGQTKTNNTLHRIVKSSCNCKVSSVVECLA